MKFELLLVLLACSAVSGLSANPVGVWQYHAVQTNGDGWRFFYSTDPNIQQGWTRDSVVFKAYPTLVDYAVPVYQYHAVQTNGDGWRFYYALDSLSQDYGWTLDGIAFWIFPTQRAGTIPIYQYHAVQSNGDGWRFYYSTQSTNNSGWTYDKLFGYALPA